MSARRPAPRPFDLSVYLVTDAALCGARGVPAVVERAVAGGATMVQLRDKEASTRVLLEEALALLALLRPLGIPLIVNDRVDVALAAGADGVHVGQDDMPALPARRLIGEGLLLGVSVGSEAEARGVDPGLVDYAGIGPVFATATKPDAGAALGLDRVRALRRMLPVPAVGIGGIDAGNAAAVVRAGADGVAVVSAICAAADPQAAAEAVAAAVRHGRADAGEGRHG